MGDVLGPTVSEVQRIFNDQIESSRGSLKNITKRRRYHVVRCCVAVVTVCICTGSLDGVSWLSLSVLQCMGVLQKVALVAIIVIGDTSVHAAVVCVVLQCLLSYFVYTCCANKYNILLTHFDTDEMKSLPVDNTSF